jgi:hypothetical protein
MYRKNHHRFGVCFALVALLLAPQAAMAALSCTAQADPRNLRTEGAAELVVKSVRPIASSSFSNQVDLNVETKR